MTKKNFSLLMTGMVPVILIWIGGGNMYYAAAISFLVIMFISPLRDIQDALEKLTKE